MAKRQAWVASVDSEPVTSRNCAWENPDEHLPPTPALVSRATLARGSVAPRCRDKGRHFRRKAGVKVGTDNCWSPRSDPPANPPNWPTDSL